MKNKKYAFVFAVALFAGFVGGAVSGRLFSGNDVLAQEKVEPQRSVTANEFRLVSDDGRTLAVLGGRPGAEPFLPIEAALRFYDRDGELRILIGLMPGDVPHIGILDSSKNLIWKAPLTNK
ncbi:MAG: hypothetical protein KKH68_11440 [Proteobacteria bacterium]|nr:hypothetical protein [Pseudomonadota bacterium]